MGIVASLHMARKGGKFGLVAQTREEARAARIEELTQVAPLLEAELEHIFGVRLKCEEHAFKEIESPLIPWQYSYTVQFQSSMIYRHCARTDMLFPVSGRGRTRCEAVAQFYYALSDGLAAHDSVRKYENRYEDVYNQFSYDRDARRFTKEKAGWDFKPQPGAVKSGLSL